MTGRTSLSRAISLWAPVALYMTAIFFVSALPGPPIPERVSDKTLHVAAYAVLGVLAVRAVAGGLPRRVSAAAALSALAITAGYGAFDEVHQAYVPGRFGDLADWYADCAGALVGIGVCWAWGIIAPRFDA